jgi:hypothetical protein
MTGTMALPLLKRGRVSQAGCCLVRDEGVGRSSGVVNDGAAGCSGGRAIRIRAFSAAQTLLHALHAVP